MRSEKMCGYIRKLVELEGNGRLDERQMRGVYNILRWHDISDYNIESLYEIANDLIPREFKTLGETLIENGIILNCGICGHPIRKVGQLSVDHKMARSKGGENTTSNLHWSHQLCNHIKASNDGYVSFEDDDSEIIAQFRLSDTYLLLIERVRIMKINQERERVNMRPHSKCNHSSTWNNSDIVRYHKSRRTQ
jgi:hypothetical protein